MRADNSRRAMRLRAAIGLIIPALACVFAVWLAISYSEQAKRQRAYIAKANASYSHEVVAVKYFRLGRYAEAAKEYEAALQIMPDDVTALERLEFAHEQTGRHEDAERVRKEISRLEIESVQKLLTAKRAKWGWGHVILGRAYLDVGRASDAIKEYKTALQHNPDSPNVLLYLGDAYDKMGRHQDAVAQWQKALRGFKVATRMDARSVDSWWGAARAYSRLGQPNNAIDALKRAREVEPDWFEFHARELLDECTQLAQLRPDDPDVHFTLGQAYFDLDRYQEAETEGRRVLQLQKDYVREYLVLGRMYVRTDRYAEADAAFQDYMKEKTDKYLAATFIAREYDDAGVYDQSARWYENAIKIDSRYDQDHYFLGRAYLKSGNVKAAEEQYDYLMEHDEHWARNLRDEIKHGGAD